jgi:hypothetical protein
MMRCCQTTATCLIERQRVMRINGPHGWSLPCMDCIEGCARQMDRHVPEPDLEPRPVRDAGKPKVKRPPDHCATCGKVVTRGAKQCKPCRGKARTALMPKKCTSAGCRWKARRDGMCHSHYFAKKKADTKAYRDKAHRIAEMRRAHA